MKTFSSQKFFRLTLSALCGLLISTSDTIGAPMTTSTNAWDKTFAKSDKVNHQKVNFKTVTA